MIKTKKMSKRNNHCHYSGLPSPMAYNNQTNDDKLTFEEWYDENEDKIWSKLEQSGATHELDFNAECDVENMYRNYLDEYDDGGN